MAEELTGHAVPMAGLPFDHTYVTASTGARWGCGGRDEGGRILCRGAGQLRLAGCLACPDGLAGIRYGAHGVCHQIANRILYPAGLRVDRARGYNALFRLYGDYGLHFGSGPYWPERARCLREAAEEFLPDGLREPEATAYAMQSDPFVTQSIGRMNDLLDRELGSDLDPGVRARIEQIVAATATRQRELVLALDRGEIAPETYLDQFNRLIASDFRQVDQVLGRKAFLAVFGAPPEVAAKVIDPEAFAAAHGLNRRD